MLFIRRYSCWLFWRYLFVTLLLIYYVINIINIYYRHIMLMIKITMERDVRVWSGHIGYSVCPFQIFFRSCQEIMQFRCCCRYISNDCQFHNIDMIILTINGLHHRDLLQSILASAVKVTSMIFEGYVKSYESHSISYWRIDQNISNAPLLVSISQ